MKGRTEIRPVRIADLREIYLLGSEIFGSEDVSLLPPWNETALADIMARDEGLSLVAASKKRIAAFLIASLEHDGGIKTAVIRWLARVDAGPPALIRDLLAEFISTAGKKNIEKIVIALPERNSELIEQYRNFGFTDSKRFIIMESFLPKKP